MLTALVATAGIGDMVVHNRRRRKEWLAQKRAEEAVELEGARAAMERGEGTEDQVLLVNRTRARDEAEEARQRRPGIVRRSTGWLFGGLSKEEQKGGRLGSGDLEGMREEVFEVREDGGVLRAVEERVEERRRTGEEVLRPVGGPLDREAERTVNAAAETGRSWMGWMTGR